ncbi:MAG TPA: PQQ-binding-like beta-propeller repeat protein [Pseudonocardiaceae bacterium]|jgi:outer membrane protein assembly factor BamB
MRWVALVAALGLVAGCSTTNGGPTPSSVAPSVASRVWSLTDGFVDWPALPAKPPGNWTIKLDSRFPNNGGDVPELPYPPGFITGLTSPTELTAFSVTNAQPVWHATLPPLTGQPDPTDKPLVESLQLPGMTVIAVTRGNQIDLFDGKTGAYLFSRSGQGVPTPMLLDADHAVFDLTDTPQPGVDEVDLHTGKLLWHNGDVAACSVYVGKILCATKDVKNIALVDPATGNTSWTTSFPETTAGAAFSTTAVVGDEGYFGNGDSSDLTAINLSTGHVDWQQPTGLSIIGSIMPFDAKHVVVDGLVAGPTGSTEQVMTMALSNGARGTVYAGADTNGSSTTNGGVSAITVGGKEFLVVVDPDGSIRTFGQDGKQVGEVAADCGSAADIVGDTLGCDSTNGYTLYALPGLGVRGTFDAGGNTGISVVANVLLANVDDTVRPIKP